MPEDEGFETGSALTLLQRQSQREISNANRKSQMQSSTISYRLRWRKGLSDASSSLPRRTTDGLRLDTIEFDVLFRPTWQGTAEMD